jgi:hypothetical protein
VVLAELLMQPQVHLATQEILEMVLLVATQARQAMGAAMETLVLAAVMALVQIQAGVVAPAILVQTETQVQLAILETQDLLHRLSLVTQLTRLVLSYIVLLGLQATQALLVLVAMVATLVPLVTVVVQVT